MKRFLLLLTVSILSSCVAYKTIPIKGKYQNEPFVQKTESSIDKVWDKLVDLFATKGLPIKVIDRSSGLIVSDRASLLVTQEDKNSKLINPNAWVVVPKLYNPGNRTYLTPSSVVGEWNVRIKASENGGTIINVNLVNLKELYVDLKGFQRENVSVGISTGVFEKIIFDAIK